LGKPLSPYDSFDLVRRDAGDPSAIAAPTPVASGGSGYVPEVYGSGPIPRRNDAILTACALRALGVPEASRPPINK